MNKQTHFKRVLRKIRKALFLNTPARFASNLNDLANPSLESHVHSPPYTLTLVQDPPPANSQTRLIRSPQPRISSERLKQKPKKAISEANSQHLALRIPSKQPSRYSSPIPPHPSHAPSPNMSAFVTTLPISSSAFTATISPRTRRHKAPRSPAMLLDPHLPSHVLAANPAALEKVAQAFNSLGMPKPLVEWGHPAMMTVMVLAMGAPGAVIGWQGRLNKDRKKGVAQKRLHENIMIAFFLLAFLGGTGGTLSVAMQGFDIWESPHAKSALVVLLLLATNAVIAYSGFTIGNDGSPKGRLVGRKLHAYFGIAAMSAFLVHGVLGAKILLE